MGEEWQSIDTLKRDDRQVLFSCRAGLFIAPASSLTRELTKAERLKLAKAGTWPDYYNFAPSHWMELPPMPNYEISP